MIKCKCESDSCSSTDPTLTLRTEVTVRMANDHPTIPASKCCTVCKQVKGIDEFHKARGFRDGHRSVCKACRVTIESEYRDANKDRIAARRREYSKTEHARSMGRKRDAKYRAALREKFPFKECSRCGHTKPFEEFDAKLAEGRLAGKCKDCRREAYLEQRDKACERSSKHYRENREAILERDRQHRRDTVARQLIFGARN